MPRRHYPEGWRKGTGAVMWSAHPRRVGMFPPDHPVLNILDTLAGWFQSQTLPLMPSDDIKLSSGGREVSRGIVLNKSPWHLLERGAAYRPTSSLLSSTAASSLHVCSRRGKPWRTYRASTESSQGCGRTAGGLPPFTASCPTWEGPSPR